jgi:hypothetical protein
MVERTDTALSGVAAAHLQGVLRPSTKARAKMANRNLTHDELTIANELLAGIREDLSRLSGGAEDLLWAFRRKVYKELIYDERGKPMHRRRLKEKKREEQHGLCAICQKPLPEKYVVLDRIQAMAGYTLENTQLVHQRCDEELQGSRAYS